LLDLLQTVLMLPVLMIGIAGHAFAVALAHLLLPFYCRSLCWSRVPSELLPDALFDPTVLLQFGGKPGADHHSREECDCSRGGMDPSNAKGSSGADDNRESDRDHRDNEFL
jgi:hypothetical protein